MSKNDPIIAEIHEYRAQHAAAFEYDVRAIVAELIRQQEQSAARGTRFVESPGKKCKPGLCYTLENEPPTVVPPITSFPPTTHAPPSSQSL